MEKGTCPFHELMCEEYDGLKGEIDKLKQGKVHDSDMLIRLHEQRMETVEKTVDKVEKRVYLIPWTFLIAAINFIATLLVLILRK